MYIPFFSLKRQWQTCTNKLTPAMLNVLNTQHYIGGQFVNDFEQSLAQYLNAKHIISCNSGTDALWLALKALNLQTQSLVLTTPFSFIASSSEIVAHGGIPLFIDIEESTYNISPQKIKNWLEKNAQIRNNKTIHSASQLPIAGILFVNIFGQCADYNEIKSIATTWNLWTIEDAAQSLGAKYGVQYSGTLADISCFSFYPTKNLGACGDGGALATNQESLATYIKQLKNHGRQTHYQYLHLGINSRLDAIQAALLKEKLALLDQFNKKRQTIASLYHFHLKDVPFVRLPQTNENSPHIFHQYAIQVIDNQGVCYRDELIEHLKQNDIETRVFYPQALHQIDFLVPDRRFITRCPIAERVTKTILCLPIWPELTSEEIAYICDCIKSMPITIPKEKTPIPVCI